MSIRENGDVVGELPPQPLPKKFAGLKKKLSIRKTQSVARFSALVSTAEQYKTTDDMNFYGPYAHIRKELDYSYHSHYRKERQWLQDSIIGDLLESVHNSSVCTTPTEPWLIYTVGAPGAGKRHSLLSLIRQQKLLLLSFVHVDPDDIRRRLPEFASYVKKCPERVNELTRREAGYIVEILTLAAVQAGKNVVLDGSVQDGTWYKEFNASLHENNPDLKIALIHVTASYESIMKRATALAQQTGRVVPEKTIEKALNRIPQSLDQLKDGADYFCTLSNEDTVELVTEGETWDNFTATFSQTCAWVPGQQGGGNNADATEEEKKEATEASLLAAPDIMKKKIHKAFTSVQSSEDNHRSDVAAFWGPFSHIRSTLDYNYHAHYTRKRQNFQDSIINDMLDSALITDKDGNVCTTPTEPWIVFTAGAMGAGKGYTMAKLVEKGRFPLLAFVQVDPDEIRRYLPEFHIYVNESPELAGELTRKEAGFIAEILTLAAMQSGKNVLVDGSLRDSDWYKVYFARLKKEFPIVRQAIVHVKAPREAVFQRAAERAKTTGRVVPRATLEMALEQVPRSVKILGPLVDYFCELNNAPGVPDIEMLTEGETWVTFESKWIQSCAWVPSRRKFLKSSRQHDEKLALGGMKTH